MKKIKVIHIQSGFEGNILGVCDNDKDVKKIIREYIKSYYKEAKKYIGNDYYIKNNIKYDIYSVMKKALGEWHSIKISEINMNEFISVLVFIE